MLEILFFALLGIVLGFFTGLIPGLHVNTLIPLLFSVSFFVQNPLLFSVFIISLAVAQIFSNYIPSIFLGAPDEDTALSILPGHKILFEGRGYEALKLVAVGGTLSLFMTIVFIFSLSNFFKSFYEFTRPFLHLILSVVILAMIFSEKNFKKMLLAGCIILLSGFLGFLVLNSSFVNKTNVMFPLLAGLFGLSTLITSIQMNSQIPSQQTDSDFKISLKKILLSSLLGSLAGIAVGFLPAIGVSQAATFVQTIGKLNDPRNFLVSLSGINVANEIFSLNSLYLVGNPRSGASVAIERAVGEVSFNDILLYTGVISLAVALTSLLTIFLGKRIVEFLCKLNYRKLSVGILLLVCTMIFLTTGFEGLLVTFASTAIGILCAHLNVKRTNCMGALLLPTTFFFAGSSPLIISFLGL